MSQNKQVPVGTEAQRVILKMKMDSSQEVPSQDVPSYEKDISRSTIFRSKMAMNKKKFDASKARDR